MICLVIFVDYLLVYHTSDLKSKIYSLVTLPVAEKTASKSKNSHYHFTWHKIIFNKNPNLFLCFSESLFCGFYSHVPHREQHVHNIMLYRRRSKSRKSDKNSTWKHEFHSKYGSKGGFKLVCLLSVDYLPFYYIFPCTVARLRPKHV